MSLNQLRAYQKESRTLARELPVRVFVTLRDGTVTLMYSSIAARYIAGRAGRLATAAEIETFQKGNHKDGKE